MTFNIFFFFSALIAVVNSATAGTTRYWDCGPPHCGNNGVFDWESPMPHDKALKRLVGHPSGAKFYGTAAASTPIMVQGGNVRAACGDCYLLHETKSNNKIIVQINNYCPGDSNPACTKPHFDVAAPGFDWAGASVSNICRQKDPALLYEDGRQPCAEAWDPKTCRCDAVSTDKLLVDGCKNFQSLGWNNPKVEYRKVSCPSANYIRGGSGGGGGSPQPSRPSPRPSGGGGGGCRDIPVPGDPNTCQQQAGWGNCNKDYMKGRCDKSCGRCGGGSRQPSRPSPRPRPSGGGGCRDIPVPGDPNTCQQQAGWGNCHKDYMRGRCDKSCGRCRHNAEEEEEVVEEPEEDEYYDDQNDEESYDEEDDFEDYDDDYDDAVDGETFDEEADNFFDEANSEAKSVPGWAIGVLVISCLLFIMLALQLLMAIKKA